MIVNVDTLLQLPIGTLFHEEDDEAIYEIVDYSEDGKDLYVSPLFHGVDPGIISLGVSRISPSERAQSRWYILQREDKNKIAKKMGFEPSGIKILGLKF